MEMEMDKDMNARLNGLQLHLDRRLNTTNVRLTAVTVTLGLMLLMLMFAYISHSGNHDAHHSPMAHGRADPIEEGVYMLSPTLEEPIYLGAVKSRKLLRTMPHFSEGPFWLWDKSGDDDDDDDDDPFACCRCRFESGFRIACRCDCSGQ